MFEVYIICFQCTGGLSATMWELLAVINYVMDNNVNLPWVAWAIVFKLSLDLGGRVSFVATILASTSNKSSII